MLIKQDSDYLRQDYIPYLGQGKDYNTCPKPAHSHKPPPP